MNFGTLLLYLYLVVQVIVITFLLQPFILLVIYGIARLFGIRPRSTPYNAVTKQYRFGIVITAHRETDFIPPIVDSLLKQTHRSFNVYIVADDCDSSTLKFKDPRIHILTPGTPLNNQIASLDYGFRHLDENDEVLVIFDPDNLVHPNFLKVMNAWYNKGYLAVQGNLRPKNTEGIYAQLDGFGNSLGNFVEREMRSMLGLSASIWGCGISVEKKVYSRIAYDHKSTTGGFDKHLQAEIAKEVPCIAYAHEAIFYDEKVDDGHNFERQRTRWITAWFKFIWVAFGVWFLGLRKKSFNLLYFGYNLMRLPYFLLLLLAVLHTAGGWLIDARISQVWLAALGLFLASFAFIIARDIDPRHILKNIWYVPLIFYHQLRALFRMRIGKKSLLKTEHTKVLYIDELLEKPLQPRF